MKLPGPYCAHALALECSGKRGKEKLPACCLVQGKRVYTMKAWC